MNPFDEAYRALWAAIFANPAFTTEGNPAYVRPLNRLTVLKDIQSTLAADKRVNRAPADTTELGITQGGFTLSPQGQNSKSADAEQTYILQLVEDRPTVERLNALKWETLVSIARNLRDQRHPFGLPYVRGVRIQDAREGRDVNEDAQPTGDWVAVCSIVLEMYFDKSLL
jgi:hypothetical protein